MTNQYSNIGRHVTHKILQERNYEGQTLLAIIEVNRVNLAESLPLVLKKEYGCHRRETVPAST